MPCSHWPRSRQQRRGDDGAEMLQPVCFRSPESGRQSTMHRRLGEQSDDYSQLQSHTPTFIHARGLRIILAPLSKLMRASAGSSLARRSTSLLRPFPALRRDIAYTTFQPTVILGRWGSATRMSSSSTSQPSVAAPDANSQPTPVKFELSDVTKHGKPLGEGNYIR